MLSRIAMQLANISKATALSISLHLVGSSVAFSGQAVAQVDLRGECRQANRDLVVHEERSDQSDEVLRVSQHEFLYVDEVSPLGGWIAIRWPASGFVPGRDLAPNCDLFPQAPTEFCVNDQLRGVEFLSIYEKSQNNSKVEDTVFPGERIHVLGEPEVSAQTNTRWLEINHPAVGWVEYDNRAVGVPNFVPCNVPEDES